MLSFSITGQNSNLEFGVKGGLNYSTYQNGFPLFEFERSLGYFVGGYGNISINDNFKFQTEILFANQGTDYKIDYTGIILPQNPEELTFNENLNGKVEELTIVVPILAQYYFSKKFYIELGPQFGFIINRKEIINGKSIESDNYDSFDFGISPGIGLLLTEKIGISAKYLVGIIERDSEIKSSVLNLGISYKIGQ